MNHEWETRFYDALGPLMWGFEFGDEGWLLRLAMDSADSLLRELPRLRRRGEKGLVELLEALAEEGMAERVAAVYQLASESDYAGGFTEASAKALSRLAANVASDLEDFARRWSRGRGPAKSKGAKVQSGAAPVTKPSGPRPELSGGSARQLKAKEKKRGK